LTRRASHGGLAKTALREGSWSQQRRPAPKLKYAPYGGTFAVIAETVYNEL
jgi:hypothetical protein